MPVKKNARRQASGGARLVASGKRPVLLGLAPDQHECIAEAAAATGRPVTQFLIFHGLMAAKKILEKSVKPA